MSKLAESMLCNSLMVAVITRKLPKRKPTWEELRAQIAALETENLNLRMQLKRIAELARRDP